MCCITGRYTAVSYMTITIVLSHAREVSEASGFAAKRLGQAVGFKALVNSLIREFPLDPCYLIISGRAKRTHISVYTRG